MAHLAPPKKLQALFLPEEPEGAQSVPQQRPREVFHIPTSIMSDDTRHSLADFLKEEIREAEAERSEFVRKLSRWKVAYKAPIPKGPKNFPIHNASNVTMPVIKEAVNTIVAQLIQATMTAKPRWVFEGLSTDWEPFVDELQTFMDLASGPRDMDLDPAFIDWITECAKLGTSILSMEYEVDERKIYEYTADGTSVYPRTVVDNDGPRGFHIPLQKFWIRFAAKSIQRAKWCATELEFTEDELRAKEDQGKFHNVDAVVSAAEDIDDLVTRDQQRIERTEPLNMKRKRKKYRIFRVFASFDVDEDGQKEEVMVYYHLNSNTLLGEFFNPYWHGKRPFVKIGYFPVEDRFYDEGLCEMIEQLQVAISSWVNRRGDNATLANLKMFIVRKMSRTLKPGDPLYSGKVIEATDIFNDIREFQPSEIYPSTVNEEALFQNRVDRVAGTNEAVLGSAMPVTRTTASAQLALLQEQAKRIDLTVRSIRKGVNEVGSLSLALYSQYGTIGKGLAWMGERGRIVDAVFRLPRRVIELGAAMTAQTPTSLQNKQVKRENKIAIFNLLVQAHERIIPLAQQFAPEGLPEIIRGLVSGTRKFLTDVMETFDEPDPEGILASLATLERILPQPEDLGGLGDFNESVRSAELFNNLSRVENILREVEGIRGSNSTVRPEREPSRISPPEGVLRGAESGIRPGGESEFSPQRGNGGP